MNNLEKNKYVINNIFKSIISLLQEKEFDNISITEITQIAQVSRNSFYRNFSSKEDIIENYISNLLSNWEKEYKSKSNSSNAELFGSLFHHLRNHSDFYLLLNNRHLFHIFSNAYLNLYGPTEDDSNIEAYTKRFIASGVLGWIEEWIHRGMTESAESMVHLLKSNGMD